MFQCAHIHTPGAWLSFSLFCVTFHLFKLLHGIFSLKRKTGAPAVQLPSLCCLCLAAWFLVLSHHSSGAALALKHRCRLTRGGQTDDCFLYEARLYRTCCCGTVKSLYTTHCAHTICSASLLQNADVAIFAGSRARFLTPALPVISHAWQHVYLILAL